jgi:hypothetical protein
MPKPISEIVTPKSKVDKNLTIKKRKTNGPRAGTVENKD